MVDAEMSVMSDKSCIVKFCRSFASLHKSCNVFTIFPFYSFFGQENSNSGLPQTVIIRIWYCPAKPLFVSVNVQPESQEATGENSPAVRLICSLYERQ